MSLSTAKLKDDVGHGLHEVPENTFPAKINSQCDNEENQCD